MQNRPIWSDPLSPLYFHFILGRGAYILLQNNQMRPVCQPEWRKGSFQLINKRNSEVTKRFACDNMKRSPFQLPNLTEIRQLVPFPHPVKTVLKNHQLVVNQYETFTSVWKRLWISLFLNFHFLVKSLTVQSLFSLRKT